MDVPGGPPLVVGEVAGARAGRRSSSTTTTTSSRWTRSSSGSRAPFDPVVEDGKLFARGVADTKGNTAAQAFAQAAVREVVGPRAGEPPVHGRGRGGGRGPHLPAFARQHPALFPGAGATIEGAGHTPQGRPGGVPGAARGSSTSSCSVRTGRRRPAQLARRVAAEPRLAPPGRAPGHPELNAGACLIPASTTASPPDPRGARLSSGRTRSTRASGRRRYEVTEVVRRQDAARTADRLLLQPDLQHRRHRVRPHRPGQQDDQSRARGGEARLPAGAGPATAAHPGRARGASPPEGIRRHRGDPAQHCSSRAPRPCLVADRAGADGGVPGRLRAPARGLPVDGRLVVDVLLHERGHAGARCRRESATAGA